MIKMAARIASGKLKRIGKVKAYRKNALERISDLHFELYEVTSGVNSVTL